MRKGKQKVGAKRKKSRMEGFKDPKAEKQLSTMFANTVHKFCMYHDSYRTCVFLCFQHTPPELLL